MPKPLNEDTPLTMRQKKFVKKFIETGNQAKAASLAGYAQPGEGSYLTKQPKIQTSIQKALDDAGLTDVKVADLLKDGTKAYYVKKDGGRKYPDFHARDKSVDKIIKIKGGYAPEKHEIMEKKLVIILSPETRKGLIDARAITEEEADVIEAEVLAEEEIDA